VLPLNGFCRAYPSLALPRHALPLRAGPIPLALPYQASPCRAPPSHARPISLANPGHALPRRTQPCRSTPCPLALPSLSSPYRSTQCRTKPCLALWPRLAGPCRSRPRHCMPFGHALFSHKFNACNAIASKRRAKIAKPLKFACIVHDLLQFRKRQKFRL
jgi:hypothetical protein